MRRPLLGWALILYGLLGIALVVGGAAIGLGLASQVERLAVTADGTLAAAVRSTDPGTDVGLELVRSGATISTEVSVGRQ